MAAGLLKNTVIRAGAGSFYSDTKLIEAQFAMVAPPFNTPLTITNPVTNPVPQFVVGQNIFRASTRIPMKALRRACRMDHGLRPSILEPNTYVNQWNFSIQHSFAAGDVVELVYLGSSGHNQQNRYEGAQCIPGPDLRCDPATKPYPRYAVC